MNPIARGLATLAAAGGSVLARDPLPLALLWTIGIMPLIIQGRIVRQHVRFICLVLMPIAVGLIVVWGWIVGAPPGLVPASAPAAGIRFAAATSLRLAVLGGIWQLCFLTLPPTALAGTLRIWGIRRDFLLVVLGSFAVIPEMNLRARQVLVARAARGFLRRARWWSKVRQVPLLMPPLVAWMLRSSLQRGELWRHRGLLQKLDDHQSLPEVSWSGASISVLCGASGWLVYAILSRLL